MEDLLHKDISNHPLWSAKLIEEDPGAIVAAHTAFLEAGADIVLTPTYQCAIETFTRAGYSADQGSKLMLKGVSLAVKARDLYASTLPPNSPAPKIGLSLGPYGSTLSPAQEFDGFYPPPFGPLGVPENPNSEPLTTMFSDSSLEAKAELALAEFHLRRLLIYANDEETWSSIDYLAFETVPLLREARAIRRAMTQLEEMITSSTIPWFVKKPWWILFVFSDGRFAEEFIDNNGSKRRLRALEVAKDILSRSTLQMGSDVEPSTAAGHILARPSGIGVNCTRPDFIYSIVQEISQQAGQLSDYPKIDLVVYPNGGYVYDVITQTWSSPTASQGPGNSDEDGTTSHPVEGASQGAERAEAWAAKLFEVVEPWTSTFKQVIIGGCCKTGPEDIRALKRLVERHNSSI